MVRVRDSGENTVALAQETLGADQSGGSGQRVAKERIVMATLLIIYSLNFLDRQILNILAEPIKQELDLADWHIGLMGGLAFAAFYTFMGIPFARLADRPKTDRSLLISTALAAWSAATVVCGLVTSFPQLVASRIAVGIGEAGCTPAAHSLISDLVPPERRGRAMGFYSMGIPIGGLLGTVIGGLVAETYGWRVAFVVVGVPGLLVAILAKKIIKDPRRLRPPSPPTKMSEAWRVLRASPTFWFTTIGVSLLAFVGYATSAFLGSLLIRVHGLPVGSAGIILGLLGIPSVLGTWYGGWLADRLGKHRPAAYVWVPAFSAIVASVFFAWGALASNLIVAAAAIAVGQLLSNCWLGPGFATVQRVMPCSFRATAAAVHLFLLNLIGLGLGPLMFGLLSDGFNHGMSLGIIDIAPRGPEVGLQLALACGPIVPLLALIFFALGARTIGIEFDRLNDSKD